MRRALTLCALLAATAARAEDPVAPASGTAPPTIIPDLLPLTSPAYVPHVPPLSVPGLDPALLSPRNTEPFAQPIEAGGQPSRTFNENFDGDPSPIYYKQTIVTSFQTQNRVVGFSQQVTGFTQTITTDGQGNQVIVRNPIITNVPITVQERVPVTQTVRLPIAGRYNGVSVVEWGNPIPRDHAYFGYNYYSNVGGALNPGGVGSDMQRQTAGFEKTIFDNASIGIRIPFVQQYGPFGFGSQVVGDLTVILKYAAFYNRQTGNAITGGLAITAPTGGGTAYFPDGTEAPHSTLLQPWAGFVRNFGRGYVQGISNLIVPTDSRDVTLWGNSVGFGYWLYRSADSNSLLTAITPIAEVHVRTPLNHRDIDGDIYFQDQVNVTTGMHFRFNRLVLSGAVVFPLVGPNPFDVEGVGFLSYWF
jgi:hypothetical protein